MKRILLVLILAGMAAAQTVTAPTTVVLLGIGHYTGAALQSRFPAANWQWYTAWVTDGPTCAGGGSGPAVLCYSDGITWKTLSSGGGGGGAGYLVPFTSQTTVSVPGTTHNLGSKGIVVTCYDNASPGNYLEPGTYTVNPTSFDVTIQFLTAKTGYCALIAASGTGGGGGGGGGITSINGNTNAAQTIAAGTGITVNSSAGTTTITNTGGTGTAGITSINGNTNAAQTFTSGSGINVTSSGGTTTISNTGVISEVVFAGTSDAVKDCTCSTTVGSPNLTCSDAPFSTCPTAKTISVTDALTSGAGEPNSLMTTVSSCSSSTVAVLAANATRASSGICARWGTDNGPALFSQANASTTAGKSFVIPAGNYLVRSTTTADITGQTNTSYTISAGAHIYWIGPTGCSSNDTACPAGIDSGLPLMFIPSSTSGGRDTHNVHIELDGIIEGDNTDSNAVGFPYLNQSAVVTWTDGTLTNSSVTDVSITGSGTVLNLYGFSIHGIGGSRNNIIGITHNHVAKGLNVNSNDSLQNNNTFLNSLGIEAAGTNISISNNHFDNSMGISVGGNGGGVQCTGYIVNGNSFTNMPIQDLAGNGTSNISLSQCPVGAVIAGNAFFIPSNPGITGPPVAINVHDDTSAGDTTPTRDNLIVGNTFTPTTDPRGCYAAVFTYGTATYGNTFVGNRMSGPCRFGYVINTGIAGHPEIIKNDTLMGNGGFDLVTSPYTLLQGTHLYGTGTLSDSSGNLASTPSWYNSPAGLTHVGTIAAGALQDTAQPPSQVACFKTGGVIGHCTSIVNTSGTCTCN